MKIYYLPILTLGIFCSTASAQVFFDELEIRKGTEMDRPGTHMINEVLDLEMEGFITLSDQYEELYLTGGRAALDKFDENMQLVKSVELPDLAEFEDMDIHLVVAFAQNILVVYSEYEKDFFQLYLKTIDKETLAPSEETQKLARYRCFSKSDYKNVKYDFDLSPGGHFLGIRAMFGREDDEKPEFGFIVLDQALVTLWSEVVSLPFESELFGLVQFHQGPLGGIYLLFKTFREKRQTVHKDEFNVEYHVWHWADQETKPGKYRLKPAKGYPTEVQLATDSELKIILSGFYSNEMERGPSGYFYTRLEPDLSGEVSDVWEPFLDKTVADIVGKGTYEKLEKKEDEIFLQPRQLREVVFHESGEVSLVSEHYGRVTSTSRNRVKIWFHYGPLIVMRLNADGTRRWSTVVPKMQMSSNDDGLLSSFDLMTWKDRLYLFYNDHINNRKYKYGDELENSYLKDRELVVARIDAEGNMEKAFLPREFDAAIRYRPKKFAQLKENEHLLYGESRRFLWFGKAVGRE